MMTDTATAAAVEHGIVATRLGDLTVVRAGEQLTGVYFPHHWHRPDPATFGPRTGRGLDAVARQLGEYLAGARQEFDLPLRARGTELQLRIWELIAQVPYGRTTTYGDLARRAGGGLTPQEAGAAVGANPLSILIPCHRVIGSTGKLTGYAGGLARKRELLDLERGQLTVPA